MNRHRPPFRREHERAVALVIVLAFVVLITGLVIAFFSNSLLYRQISNSSASAAKVDLFAQGAVDTIVGDLKQEITAGSTNSTPAPGFTVCVPRAPLSAVPCPVGTPDPVATKNGCVNLIKRSAYDYANGVSLPFYANPAATPTPYDTNTYAPSRRAAGVSSLTPSQNGRSISPARWNKHLLLEKKSAATTAASGQPDTNDTDFTPIGATAGSGSTAAAWPNAPDWVLVARDGSNPTGAFNGNMVASPSGAGTVIGRYAYAIYDEGGLLDANIAGYPLSGNPPYTNSNSDPKSSYKSALAFADLTQLPGISALSTGRQMAVINSLTGWRNYASAQPGGSLVAGFTFSAAQLANFTAAMTGNSNGFLKTSNQSLYQGQSDRMFSTRQELLHLLLNGIATSGSSTAAQTERANLQNALQYVGTFSRGLEQPSYIPGTLSSGALPTPTPQPTAAPIGSGGNDASPLGGDAKINPAFLTARATAGFTRNDGSTANVGDPLVAKRFALSRLAWITFKGPICTDDNGTLSTDSDIQLVITQLQNQGISLQVLQQGGPANIQKYFGLSWVTDTGGISAINDGTKKWRYLHGNSGNGSAILRLDQITGRDPDFFELLKAAVTVGSEAKGAGVLTAFPYVAGQIYTSATSTYQTNRDTSTDAFIIQLGANIINQAAVDGYPRRILFNDGSYPGVAAQEYRGVTDVPYIYRTRGGYFKLHEAIPALDSNSYNVTKAGPISDYGLGIFLEQPEIWNPHTWNPATVAAVPATLRPVNFRFTMLSKQLPNYAALGTTTPVAFSRIQDGSFNGQDPSTDREPTPVSLTADNTELDFSIPAGRADLFREPTLLNKPLVPTGSNLQTGAKHLLRTDPMVSQYLGPAPATSGSAKSIYLSAAYTTQSPPVADSQYYLGVYFGAFPLWFSNAKPAPNNGYVAVNRATFLNQLNFIYRLEYQDPSDSSKWAVYDEKFMPLCFTDRSGTLGVADEEFGSGPAGFAATSSGIDSMIAYGNAETYCDPRTARFSTEPLTNSNTTNFFQFPPYVPYNNWMGWVNASQNAAFSVRSDEYPGDPGIVAPAVAAQGFYNYYMTTFPTKPNIVAFGWYMQNDPSLPTSGGMCSYSGANGQGGTSSSQYYADADGIVRRATGAYVTPSATLPATPGTTPSGLPTRKGATTYNSSGVGSPSTEGPSRPLILNRPFRSVAELGYVFSGTPWKNIDFFTPESGYAALLDVFCINDTDNSSGLVAAKVNLNTRQEPVLKAILSGAYKDEATAVLGLSPTDSDTLLQDAANGLMTRTSSTALPKGPLRNISDLVGKWTNNPVTLSGGGTDGKNSFDGFSKDLGNISVVSGNNAMKNSERYREAIMRALSGCGQTRVWNLMVDLVAQTGRYPVNAQGLSSFLVEGEQRYWLHLAIDRYTGQVIDKQIELVKE